MILGEVDMVDALLREKFGLRNAGG